jgi:hypothetical protein
MPRQSRLALIWLFGPVALFAFWSLAIRTDDFPGTDSIHFEGEVRDAQGPIAGAVVRVKGRAPATCTDSAGRFHLIAGLRNQARITAWKPGYFINGTQAKHQPLQIVLTPLPGEDSAEHAWVDPSPDPTSPDNCANCHREIYREWRASSHAHSATNRHFLSYYDGADWHNNPGAGWSLRAEHPDGLAVCTACHAPSVRDHDPAYFDLAHVQGVSRQGVHCDYCHKIADAGLGTIGLTHGRFGLKLLRPADGQLFFGPLDDVDRGEDSYSPLYRDSRYCASCHEGTVFGVHVYSTYSEWLTSRARYEGKQCQTCHLASTGQMTNIAPGHGGIERDPSTLGNHRFFRGSQLEMLQGALRLSAKVDRDGESQRLEVSLRADGAGHRVPTGFLDRHLLLVVTAEDAAGKAVQAMSGPVLPDAAGKELAGTSGRIYAKGYVDPQGQPIPFWQAGGESRDNRLVPGQEDKLSFQFPLRSVHIHIRLIYRKTWADVARQKQWPDNDLLVFEQSLAVAMGR